MGIPLLVVEHSPLLDRFLGDRQIDQDGPIATWRGGFHRKFEGIEQAAGITPGHLDQMVPSSLAKVHLAISVAPVRVSEGLIQQTLERLRF